MSINLMPWREARRKQRQKDFLSKLGLAALGGIGFIVIGYAVLSATISGQERRNSYLDNQIAEANKAIEEIKTLEARKQSLLGRKNVIETLQANRDQLAHIYYELANTSVDGVLLNSLEHKNGLLEIKGKSTSNSAVASFMNQIERSEWFKNPEIVIIQNEELGKSNSVNIDSPILNRYSYDFTVKAQPVNPNAPEEEEETSGAKKDRSDPKNRKRN